MLDEAEKINAPLIYNVVKKAFSQIPLFRGDKNKVVGLIDAKSMLLHNECVGKTFPESKMKINKPVFVARDTNLLELLNIFQTQKTSLVFITNNLVRNTAEGRGKFHSVLRN